MDKTPAPAPQARGPFGLSRPMQILIGGTVLGVLLLLVGVFVLFRSLDVFLGGVDEWRKNWYLLGIVLLAEVAGLGVLFATLQQLRGEERERAWVRHLVYGYNTFLAVLLLLEVLAFINFLAYTPAPPFNLLSATYDWTENRQYSLGPNARKFLGSLDHKITIKVMLPDPSQRNPDSSKLRFVVTELNSLLDQMQWAAGTKLVIDRLSPDHAREAISGLVNKYKDKVPERMGVLIIYGTEPDERVEFIKYDELATAEDATGRRFSFTGEQVLLSKLDFLAQGQKKTTVYFTQGNGELDLMGMQHFSTGEDEGLGILRQRLEKGPYIIKPLRFDLETDKVPDDAEVVVVARPTRRFPQNAITALNEYMGVTALPSPGEEAEKKSIRKGKMIVMFDVVPLQQSMAVTLEDFVRQFGVEVDSDRLLWLQAQLTPVTSVMVSGSSNSDVPFAQSLRENEEILLFNDVRPVRTGTSPHGNLTAKPMLEVLGVLGGQNQGLIRESNLALDPREVASLLLRRESRETLRQRLDQIKSNPLMAVSVEEPAPPSADPSKGPGKPVSRMIVMGDASWVANRDQRTSSGEDKLKLFQGCLVWLGDHPGLELDVRTTNTFKIKPQNELYWKLFTLPMAVLTLSIVGLGLGVWVLRRR